MSAQTHRLNEGGSIDRSQPLVFSFNGRRYQGYAGDTLASALLANGVMLVGRSFKFHRPRGIFSAGAEEPNALVQLESGAHTQPNLRATQIELYDGLEATSVNCWPGVRFDVGAVNGLFSRLLPAGFYYKTFMRPRRLWPVYESLIRRAAGLGRAPREADPDRYETMNAHTDVLVVGAGPAGLAAALAAARAGARVVMADEQNQAGGSLLGTRDSIGNGPAAEWIAAAMTELLAMDEVTLLPRTTVFGYYDHNFLAALERVTDHLGPAAPADLARQRLWRIRARQVVLATGAIERPLLFENNDRPGVMLAGAARAYVNRFAVRPGRRAVVFTNNDSAYETGVELAATGIEVAAIVDVRPNPPGAAAPDHGIEIAAGHAVVRARGSKRLSGVEVMALDDRGEKLHGAPRRIACDLLCVSGGWNPAVQLLSQSRGRLRYDDALAAFVPSESVQAERSAGAANGALCLADCMAQGYAAGAAAADEAGFSPIAGAAERGPAAAAASPPQPIWTVPALKRRGAGTKHFTDLANDVTAADIALAAREGYFAVEHVKRYTTMGMGPDQGKTGNVHGIALLSHELGKAIPEVGTTTFRPPYTPVTIGALAGRRVGKLADPVRKTPMHEWHVEAGAVFEDVGQWKRPFYYPRPGESMSEAVNRECLAVREDLGILDATTLGKIDLQGPDAVTLLNRIYANDWDTLGIGRCRYGVMLGEDGMVMDDGVTARLDDQHYLMTTTTGNAARVLAWLEEWVQTEWPELDVYMTSVTEQFATITIAGPKGRRLLSELTDDIDFDKEAFPFMSWRTGTVAEIPARVFSVSYTGELSYEINVPASYGMALWQALMRSGERYGITPFGTEAMHVLRAEKGFIMVGQDTDGTVTPVDLGMAWIVSKKKDFMGRRSLRRPDTMRADRLQMVGLLAENPNLVLPEGSQIVAEPKPDPPVAMIGHVTSSYWSVARGRSIALALVEGGRRRKGETVQVRLYAGGLAPAVIGDSVFYDPEGRKLHG